jgi:NAD(P)-dependent dehydrogenase (short-subunit alcohol dehydrogenase family)
MATVVVTGASAGVGRAVVRRFSQEGADLGLLARGTDGLEAARKEMEAQGGRALAIPTDVADAAGVEEAAGRIEQELGPIDIWVNNAMVTVLSPFKHVTPDEFRRVTEVTYLGVVYGTMAALRRMVPRDRGSIVQVGSSLAYRAIPLQSAYCGAKHAIKGFTESLRTELLHDGSNVSLSMVQLPALNTPQFDWCRARVSRQPQPVPPIYQPEVAAEAIAWAARSGRRQVWVGWPTTLTITAEKLVPGLLDHYLAESGYRSQQTDEPIPKDRRDNLMEPVPGDHGAHGRFDRRAHASSVELWASQHRRWLWAAGLGSLLVLGRMAGKR